MALDALATSQPIDSWVHEIAQAADALTATAPADAWQRAELTRLLDDIVSEADGRDEPLAPAEARAHIFERLQGRPTRANFRTGHLTVCTLMPMRSVPHRVVCLLGLDDGAFPRKAPRDGDDLMLAQPRIGERDPRSEDRQLLLDALLAATERLIVTYTGNDERTNTPRPPAVPVGELLDAIDATVRLDGGAAPRTRVLIRHPLQPFDPRNFDSGELLDGEPWSFDDVTLAGAQALTAPRLAPEPFLAQALAPREGRVVELTDLVRFVEHPVRAFLRQRLGISLGAASDEVRDALAIELDSLERWGVGQRLLEALLDGVHGNTAIKAEIRRGTLPPGVLGEPVIVDVYPLAQSIAAAAQAVAPPLRDPEPLDVRVALGDGRLLTGTVTGVSGDVLLNTTFSRVAAKHRLAAWVRLLAVTATHPERELSAATVGRAGGRDVRTALLAPLAAGPEARRELAVAQLATLVDLFDRGMREPLPIFCKTSAAYAEAARAGQDPAAAALGEWQTGYKFDLEDREPEHVLAFGGVLALAELLEIAPAPDEAGDGWTEAEPSRLGRLALRLWGGLLDREQVSSR